jgi:hypothetical protein
MNAIRKMVRREGRIRDMSVSNRICLVLKENPGIPRRLLVELASGKVSSVANGLTRLISCGIVRCNGVKGSRLYRLTARGLQQCCKIRDRACFDAGVV